VRANVICPGFVRTHLVEDQIPEQAQRLGISREDVIRKVMLQDTVDAQWTTPDEIADAAVFFASAKSLAFTGQSLLVSHGWGME
jgi:3-hydroxybutyrate dehydrogenase